MSGQGNDQFPSNHQGFGGQPSQQAPRVYGQGNLYPNAPPIARASVGQVSPDFPQSTITNSQQQMLQQQMQRPTNSQPALTHRASSRTNYAPLSSPSQSGNDQHFSPQTVGQSGVPTSLHVNGHHVQPQEESAQLAMQTPLNSTSLSDSLLERILAQLETINSRLQRQEADRAGIMFDHSRLYEGTIGMAMKLIESLSTVGVNVHRQLNIQAARALQNDGEANFNQLSGRYSTDGNGYVTQPGNLDELQTLNAQNTAQQTPSQQGMNQPNLDPTNMNHQQNM